MPAMNEKIQKKKKKKNALKINNSLSHIIFRKECFKKRERGVCGERERTKGFELFMLKRGRGERGEKGGGDLEGIRKRPLCCVVNHPPRGSGVQLLPFEFE